MRKPFREGGWGWSARKGKDEETVSRKTGHMEEGSSQGPPSNAAVLQLSPPPRSHPAMSTASAVTWWGWGVIFPHPLRAKMCPTQPVHPEPTSQFSMLPRLPSRGRMFSRINILESIFWYAVSVPVARPVFLFLQTLPNPRAATWSPSPGLPRLRSRGTWGQGRCEGCGLAEVGEGGLGPLLSSSATPTAGGGAVCFARCVAPSVQNL